jgi:two-component system, chemotaxis family, response regulator Rcp1
MAGSGSNRSQEKDLLSTSRSLSSGGSGKHQILVIEDSKTDVFLIREAIEGSQIDADIEIVRDGEAATRYFDAADGNENARCPDLVLLDLNLPKKSGVQVLKHLRGSIRCRHVKVLIVSSSDAPQDRGSVENFAVEGYFKKPTNYAGFMSLGPIVKHLLESDAA